MVLEPPPLSHSRRRLLGPRRVCPNLPSVAAPYYKVVNTIIMPLSLSLSSPSSFSPSLYPSINCLRTPPSSLISLSHSLPPLTLHSLPSSLHSLSPLLTHSLPHPPSSPSPSIPPSPSLTLLSLTLPSLLSPHLSLRSFSPSHHSLLSSPSCPPYPPPPYSRMCQSLGVSRHPWHIQHLHPQNHHGGLQAILSL